MTYKQNDVFLNAEDSAKILPYIPKEILKGWGWWYSQSGKLCFLEWFGASNGYIDGTQGRLHHVNSSYFEKFPKQYQVPALDTGILGGIIKAFRKPTPYGYTHELHTHGVELHIKNRGGIIFEESESELQNRRDALMYLIDNGLIEKEK